MVSDYVSGYIEEVSRFRIKWAILVTQLLKMTNSLNPEW